MTSAEGFSREEGISTQTTIGAIKRGIIPAIRTERGHYAFRLEDVPTDWLATVKQRRDLRWGRRERTAAADTGSEAPHANSCEFLKGQVLAQQATIDRLLTLLESRAR